MLRDEDRIFTNLYGWFDEGLDGAKTEATGLTPKNY